MTPTVIHERFFLKDARKRYWYEHLIAGDWLAPGASWSNIYGERKVGAKASVPLPVAV